MKRIILSTDHNPTYAWFVPLCALMWREVAGYEVSCIFVGPVSPWIVERANEVHASIYECATVPRCGGPAASQLIRLFSYLLPYVSPHDYLLSVDADAWPLARAFEPTGAGVDLIYPDACDRAETPYFPIGYIGALASAWREIIGIEAPTVEAAVEEMFRTDPLLSSGRANGWNYDETYITRKIKTSLFWLGAVNIRRRKGDPPIDRIDRSAWPTDLSIVGKLDAHLIRPGWTVENWPRLRPILAQCLSPSSLAWADQYRAEWVRMMEQP